METCPAATLPDWLQSHLASGLGQQSAFTFLGDGETPDASLSFAELDQQARNIAAHLQSRCAPGDRVLLVYPPGLDYICAFFGCIYAGMIAVPALPPANARTLPRLQLLANDASPRLALTQLAIAQRWQLQLQQSQESPQSPKNLPWLVPQCLDQQAERWQRPVLLPTDIAFLQYTSGSTGHPKGVMVSHQNILANMHHIHHAFGLKPQEVVVSWLPPHHDMGLIGTILYPVFAAAHSIQFPPAAFLLRPWRWLKALSDFRARITAAPNFAYQLCVSKVTSGQKQGLDLSALEFALNGAEPVRADTLRDFAAAFAGCGLRAAALTPVYGLAEATLLVSAKQAQDQPKVLRLSRSALAANAVQAGTDPLDSIELVAHGAPSGNGHQVLIVDPHSQASCADNTVGEIWISGPSVASGYWQQPAETATTFGATLANHSPTAKYLRSGDLGFIHEQQLYLAGRSKDLMIFQGRNIYPQDVEQTVEALDPAFRPNGCAVFALDDGSVTQLVILQELEARQQAMLNTLASTVRAALAEQHELIDLAAIVLVRAGHLPRTSSGKLQRTLCKARFLQDQFQVVWRWSALEAAAMANPSNMPASSQTDAAPRGDTEQAIATIWRELLDCPEVGRDVDFFSLGGHSLLAGQVLARLRTQFQVELPLRTLFEANTIATLARQVEQARLRQPALPAIEAAVRNGPQPLSFAQQRLWFLQQFDPDSSVMNLPAALLLQGQPDITALQRSFNQIVQRHQSLRSRFIAIDGIAWQIIQDNLDLALPLIDLSDLPAAERQARLHSLSREAAHTGFDLEHGPLLRLLLIRLEPAQHILLLSLHHIVADGWSMGILLQELQALYPAFRLNLPSPLSPLPIQYADFAHWQRNWLSPQMLQQELDYWSTQLADCPDLLNLPTDRIRPAFSDWQAASLPFVIAAPLHAGLQALCQAGNCTLFMGLAALFQLFLSRYSGQRDICLGTPVANRQLAETEGLIGFFVNTLVLRTRITAQQGFSELLQQVRATTLDAYSHQNLPFEQLVASLCPVRSANSHPLCQVMLNLQNMKAGSFSLPGLSVSSVAQESSSTRFDLTLTIQAATPDQALQANFEFRSDLFDTSTITRMAAHFIHLLGAVIAAPGQAVATLELLDASEKKRILYQWNDTSQVLPASQTMVHLFEQQVARLPNMPALEFEGQQLDYARLNASANQLAHHLQQLGTGPERVVALALESGPALIIAILAVLKTGAAYLALDPTHPPERLQFMLTDAKPALLLTQHHLQAALPATSINTLYLERDAHLWRDASRANPTICCQPDNLAYLIYTSGSTGRPKGVLLTHLGLFNLIQSQAQQLGLQPGQRVLQFASLNFDASTWEIFMALGAGATLCLAKREHLLPGTALAQTLEALKINLTLLPPVALGMLPPAPLPDLQTIIVGGEACALALARQWAVSRRFINAYGPTEATVCASMQRCQLPLDRVSIGTPNGNTRIYLLDPELNPVPPGVAGHLHIGGLGLARGYLGRADLTAAHFIPDPFVRQAGARMYCSGDLARYLPDGSIQYLGRLDQQIKLRGLRIEPGEIEAALMSLPQVQDALVLARADERGEKRLVAWVSMPGASGPTAPGASQLRSALMQLLPAHMVPAQFVILQQLPLTANGKVDRAALPPPMAQSSDFVAASSPTEVALAAIWASVLGQERISIHDDFFALGGHSLLAVTLLERLHQHGWVVALRTLFAAPNIAALAASIDSGHTASGSTAPPAGIPAACQQILPSMLTLIELSPAEIASIVATVPGGAPNIQDIYPLTPLQQGILFHHMLDGAGDAYQLPALLSFPSRERLDQFVQALQSVIARHDILRSAVVSDGLPQAVQVVWRSADLHLEEMQFDERAGPLADQLAAAFEPRHYQLPLHSAPLIHGALCADPQQQRWLLHLVLHHLVADHSTLEQMIDEVGSILSGQQQKLAPAMPFRNFVAQTLDASNQEAHEAFFRSMLGAVDEPSAPFGLLEVQGDGADLLEARHPLSPALALRLRQQARLAGVSAASLMHLAFALVLGRISDHTPGHTASNKQVVFGTVLSGRLQAGNTGAQALGMFINTLPLAIRVDQQSVAQCVQACHSLLNELLQHEHAALGLAQRCSGIAAPLPLFSALFNYRHSQSAALATGITFENAFQQHGIRVLRTRERSNYPLNLSVDDLGQGFVLSVQSMPAIVPGNICGFMECALQSLVQALESAPQTALCELEILPPAITRQMLDQWNQTAASYPDCTIHFLFEQQVARNPQQVALVFEDTSLSYVSLNQQANQLAHHLRQLGVGPDRLVGVYLERGIDLVLALLAILKAGGAYLPLDPALPPQRLANMLCDAAPRLVLTSQPLQAQLAANTSNAASATKVVCVGQAMAACANSSSDNPPALALPAHLAYVIYTSGSTGQPKGVMLCHNGLVNLVTTQASALAIGPQQRLLQFASINFDVSTWEIFIALCSGATLCLASREQLLPGPELTHTLHRLAVNFALLPPVALSMLDPHSLPGLQTIVTGGEACSAALARQWCNGRNFTNAYGPTETTVYVTSYPCDSELQSAPPLGRPIANTRIYLLDAQLHPVPPGVAGQLYIAGAALARGYLKRADLSAGRFIPDPFAPRPGARMYASGDLARFAADGNIEFLGRLDQQVKLRGFRIELGEIEAALLAQPGVQDALVLLREDSPGEKRLVAYLIAPTWLASAVAAQAEWFNQLRTALAGTLPDHMLPAHFLLLERMPLTVAGKIDRKQLPLPDPAQNHKDGGVTGARSAQEEILLQIFADLLKRDNISVFDDFFALGGHSLLATQLISRIRSIFHTDLPLRALFEAGSVAALAQKIKHPAAAAHPISPLTRNQLLDPGQGLPLSFAQQRLWFIDQLDPGNPLYNLPVALRMRGHADIAALTQAINLIVQRHQSLRTCFIAPDGTPRQIIQSATPLLLPCTDLSQFPLPEREREARRLAQAQAETRFDLRSGPLLRMQLLQMQERDAILLLCMHHIVSDAWSMAILLQEMQILYQALVQDLPPPLPALPLQYADFASWQRQPQNTRWLEQQANYWRSQLADCPALLSLPCDHPRPARPSHRAGIVNFTVCATTTAGLRELSRQQHCTLFMTLAAALNVLMARYSRQNDICIGTPIANRNQHEIESLIGFFVNTLVLRTRVNLYDAFVDLLQQLRNTALDAYSHQDLPFDQLVEMLNPQRDTSYTPLFQVMLALQNVPMGELSLPGLTLEPLALLGVSARFDLKIDITESADQLQVCFVYSLDLFEPSRIESMAAHFTHLLDAIIANPHQRVGELPLLAPGQALQIVRQWNPVASDWPANSSIDRQFEAQVARTPERVALRFEHNSLTYAELNARANQLAHFLQQQGVGLDDVVGLCTESSLEMMIAILGILKAGACYLPLDPYYPKERLHHMLDDARPRLLLTQQHLLERLPPHTLPVLCLDSQWQQVAAQPCSTPKPCSRPDSLAYVIYTSGSSGKPKGVMVAHGSLLNFWHGLATSILHGYGAPLQVGLNAPYSFDASLKAISQLLSGHCLVLIAHLIRMDSQALLRLIGQYQINVLNCTPSQLELLLAQGLSGQPSLQVLLIGGEAISHASWQAMQAPSGIDFINMYGPTECTVDATLVNIKSRDATPCIGRPMANASVYLLDEFLNPVPPGVAGEIFIGGIGVARGYLRRPDLCAEKFLPDPFASTPGSRMYQSGDLARHLADGHIEYLGRIDEQVKIRGFRIELGEIQAALCALPEVREALVVVQQDENSGKRLLAYLCLQQPGAVTSTRLRAALGAALPDYMVPAQFVMLQQFPLTANGKIDRKALPQPERAAPERTCVAPRNATEATLARIWAEVLKLERVGIHDNFFELGGHSFLAVTLMERMRQCELEADILTLFGAPTIAELALACVSLVPLVPHTPPNLIPPGCQAIEPDMLTLVALSQSEIRLIERAVPGGAGNIQDIYPLAPLQQGILFHHMMSQQGDVYLLPTLVSFPQRHTAMRFLQALQGVIARHDILRTSVLWEGLSEMVQVVWRHAALTIDELEFDPEQGEISAQLNARFDTRQYRLDLRHAPLIRCSIADDPRQQRCLLHILFHHLVCDRTTLELLLGEVRQLLSNPDTPLPPAMPYRNFVAQARLGLQQEAHEAFFRQMLADVDQPTAPLGLIDVQGDGTAIDECRRALDMALALRLRQAARNQGVSCASLLHLAWAQLLAQLSGQSTVVFGTVLFGRMQGGIGADRALGMFINTLPMCLRLAGQSVASAVQQTHALLTQMMQHEHASLALAQRCSGVSAPLPLFSALLNYRHTVLAENDSGIGVDLGLDGMQMLSGQERTNYPLSLSVDDLGRSLILSVQVDASIAASRIWEYLNTVLQQLANALEQAAPTALADISIVAPAERQQVLQEWNDNASQLPDDLVQLFEARAAAAPEHIALCYQSRSLSYAQLNLQANQLAHYLLSQGVGAETLVGVCLLRDTDMIIALLAIFKAGGAYVPLDPAYPAQRMTWMLDDARPGMVLTQQALLPGLQQLAPASRFFCLDRNGSQLSTQPGHNPVRRPLPHQLAYVMYTSGSSGRPKGVMIEQASLANLVWVQAQKLGQQQCQVVLQFASINFDMSIEEIFPALIMGASLIIRPAELMMPDQDFIDLICQHQIDALNLPTAFWHEWVALLAAGHSVIPDSIKLLAVGGEKAGSAQLAQWQQCSQQRTGLWINAYGPTEACVNASSYALLFGQSLPWSSIPVGRPLPNSRIYLLDQHGNPVAIGVAAELYIGGIGVARAYLHRPDLTAEKFLPDPYARQAGARMYRSGDLARHLPDGNIEYLGRIDEQIKIRGFRIEPGEIEAALSQLPGIGQAMVLARLDQGQQPQLVAYLQLQAGATAGLQASSSAQLRQQLLQHLPEYMVPQHFIVLQQWPLTPNGKINRKALPEPERGPADFVAARTPVETTLVQIWADVLQVEQLGIHDNFFALGGHSLLATRLITRIRSAFDCELPLRTLFAAPTVAALAEHIQANGSDQSIPRVARHAGTLALSFAQQRLWFLDQFDPGSTFYNMPSAVRLHGQLDIDTLERAINEIVQRHEALRTCFVALDGTAHQLIHDRLDIALPLTDLTHLPAEQRSAQAQTLVQQEICRKFNLATGPLLRASLIRLAPQHHILLFNLHHIISDGWSMGVLVQEVHALYPAFAQQGASPLQPLPPLPALPIQYADFAHWQRQWMQGPVLETQSTYWRAQLADCPGLLALPLDHPRPRLQSHRGSLYNFEIDAHICARLEALGQHSGTTLFMTLVAAFTVLLARYSGQQDICIGTPIANRNRAEIEPLIGFFVNTLVLRNPVRLQDTFAQLLQRVRSSTLDAYSHQDLPFEHLVEILKPQRHTSHSPLFQVMLILQNTPMQHWDLPSLRMEPLTANALNAINAKFDLTLNIAETGPGPSGKQLLASFEYNVDLFEAATIARMAKHFIRLLQAIGHDPQQRIYALPMLSASEQHQLMHEWNPASIRFTQPASIVQAFEARVARTPLAPALLGQLPELNYQQLNARANQLAHYLVSRGVGPERVVGVCMERGADLLIALLAILKAGAAYMPLDPAYPYERLVFMLNDAQPLLLISLSGCQANLSGHGTELLLLDEQWPAIGHHSCNNLQRQLPLEHMAYLIYTSGSTGMPKGVSNSYAGLANRLHWFADFWQHSGWPAPPVTAFKTQIGFVDSVTETLETLLMGGTLVLFDQASLLDPARLSHRLQCFAVSNLVLVPSLLRHLLSFDVPALKSLNTLICSGENLTPELIQQANNAYPDLNLFNFYGCSEANGDSIACRSSTSSRHAVLGQPIANTRVYVLDADLNPVPCGVIGELYIAGSGVARGYLQRPALSAEKFLPDPFSPQPGARMVRSGDLARHLPDGSIAYLGRLDDQVKLRGVRIELGEINAALLALPEVDEAVVLLRADPGVDARLVAYLVSHQSQALEPASLRRQLARSLPSHLVPTEFVQLPAMPLTANGKLNRQALPVPVLGQREPDAAPIGATEIALAHIWQQLLGREQIGRHENFFEIGGHSLLSMQLLVRIREQFQLDLPLATVFHTPSIAALAELVSQQQLQQFQPHDIAWAAQDIDELSEAQLRALLAQEEQDSGA